MNPIRALLPAVAFALIALPGAASAQTFTFPVAGGDPVCRDGVRGLLPNGDTDRPTESQKCGTGAVANAEGALAVGPDAHALNTNATAIGRDSTASGQNSTALGSGATASGDRSTALGSNAQATHTNATVIGYGAVSTANNQVTLGGGGTSVRFGDIAASTAAQTGPVSLVTVDASGTLGTSSFSMPSLDALQAGVDTLFDLRNLDRRDMRSGIAAAFAMANPSFPSAPGRTSYVLNAATFRGQQAVSAGLMHRLNTAEPMAISAGISYAGHGNNGARIGLAGEF